MVECVELLEERAEKYGLTRADIFKKVVHFYNTVKAGDLDGDQKITLIEFFIQLPKLEEFLINGKI